MHKQLRLICFSVLLCFSFSVAAGTQNHCDMFDMTDEQQELQDDSSSSCHADKNKPVQTLDDNCCKDMNLCSNAISYVAYSPVVVLQTLKSVNLLPTNDKNIFNISSPPTRPPKHIS